MLFYIAAHRKIYTLVQVFQLQRAVLFNQIELITFSYVELNEATLQIRAQIAQIPHFSNVCNKSLHFSPQIYWTYQWELVNFAEPGIMNELDNP